MANDVVASGMTDWDHGEEMKTAKFPWIYVAWFISYQTEVIFQLEPHIKKQQQQKNPTSSIASSLGMDFECQT